VLGLLEGGYHELDTVFCTLALHDTLEWTPGGAGFELEIVDEAGSGLPVETGEGNLVTRALRLLETELGPLPGKVVLTKRIPAGGGLGGGSADAAALLRALGGSLPAPRLTELAARLGADVAFLVARGTGRGEQLEALPAPPPVPVILAFPDFGCPTGEVYAQWDRERYRPAQGCSERVVAALRAGDGGALAAALGNDLEPAACALYPALRETVAGLAQAGCSVVLAGSGSTVCGLVPTGDASAALARAREIVGRALLTRLDGQPL